VSDYYVEITRAPNFNSSYCISESTRH